MIISNRLMLLKVDEEPDIFVESNALYYRRRMGMFNIKQSEGLSQYRDAA